MRNYSKESEREKERCKRLVYKCNKDLWIEFEKALKDNNLTYSEWIKKNIEIFLNKNM